MRLYCDCGHKIISKIGPNTYIRRKEHTNLTVEAYNEEFLYENGEITNKKVKRTIKVKMPLCKECSKGIDLESINTLFCKLLPDMAKDYTISSFKRDKL